MSEFHAKQEINGFHEGNYQFHMLINFAGDLLAKSLL